MPAKVHCGGLFLGNTIQEKTRTLLDWSDECGIFTCKVEAYIADFSTPYLSACNNTGPSPERCSTITVNATEKSLSRRILHVNNSRGHPYMIPIGRLRRYSTSSSSTCSSSSSEYSQPSPSYSITSYESLSPEPLVSPYVTADSQSPHLVPLGPTIPTTVTASTTYRSPEREAQVFERLRQLVPMLPFDRSAYQDSWIASGNCKIIDIRRVELYLPTTSLYSESVLIETVSQVMDLEQQLEQLNEQTNSAKNSLWVEQESLLSDAENSVFPDDLKSVDVTAFKRLLCSSPLSGDTSKTVHFNFVS
ncbi:unnamed protein product [Acanthocheilonema viteae]|uniref:Uncharacterized protein n=1 Tax=Acanthocheilonema viteae TaxID=6277 RepID=A0A498SL45_ACAVI|nr:unnamed protein product [Acanthocheilonema viteae]